MSETVICEVRGAIAILTLSRPRQRNSINAEMCDALRAAIAVIEADRNIRIGILTGAGDVFCAGMDLKAFLDGEGDRILFGEGRFGGFVDAARSKPLIAAVNGPALAGGFELALACDLVVASETAFFGLPEPGVGIFACAGGPFRLARKIPPARAMELVLTGGRLSAKEALELGLVNRVVAAGQGLESAMELAGQILRNAPLAIAASLALTRAANAVAEAELWTLNDRLWNRVAGSEDAVEGPSAFAQKRPPEWSGR